MACTDAIASQTRFLGASIHSFNSSIGWGGAGGSCDITVVEDTCTNTTKVVYDNSGNVSLTTSADMFNPPKLGTPVVFRFGTFSYAGILQSWQQDKKTEGKTYSIRLIDPSNILSGTQIIIDSYNGQTFYIPNLINAFAYLEYLYGSAAPIDPSLLALLEYTPVEKFGGTSINSAGISWNQVKVAIEILANSSIITAYGGRIQLRGNSFYLDLTELPFLEGYFRLSGDCLSLMDIITQVCEYAGYEFFTELTYASGSFFIRVRTTNRRDQPFAAKIVDQSVGTAPDIRLNQGKISSFINSSTTTVNNSRGLELRDEATNAFLVGDYRSDMWQIEDAGSHNGYTDTIWPYWGTNSNGYPIIGNNVDDAHNFTLDTTDWGISGVLTYNVTVTELRAATEGISQWETIFLYKHPELSALSPCSELNPNWTNEEDFKQKAFSQGKSRPLDMINTEKTNAENMSKIDAMSHIVQLYGYIYNLATNYLGKKFMVSIPYVASAWSSDEPYSIKLNFVAADSAWVETTILGLAADSIYIERFRNDDGRVSGFVHYTTDGTYVLDLAQLPQDSYIRISAYEAYVKCNVEEIIFLDPIARTYPRAVISIPGNVCLLHPDIAAGIAPEFFDGIFNNNASNPENNTRSRNLRQPNMQNIALSNGILPIMPDGAAIPLQSTTLSYGPWIANRNNIIYLAPAGKTVYNRDTSLNPWNYGSTAMMNYAGHVLVDTQVSLQQVVELGNLEQAGAPVLTKVGTTLIAGGPEVTDINCSMGINGLTTTYSFRTYTPNFGNYSNVKANSIKLNGQWRHKIQRLFKESSLNRYDNPITTSNNLVRNVLLRPDRYNQQSAGTFLIAQNIEDPVSSGCYRTSIGLTDLRKCLPEFAANSGVEYMKRAGMELGGLLRPYSSISGSAGNLSSFITYPHETTQTITSTKNKWDYTIFNSRVGIPPISGEANCPICVTTLNPFLNNGNSSNGWLLGSSQGHDIEYVVRDGVYPTDLCIRHPSDNYSEGNWYRGVALKGPLVIAGWGYDIYGKPVPNSGSNTAYFKNDWLRRPQDWKCGPVDLRWDEYRGVWTSPPPPKMLQVKVLENSTSSQGCLCEIVCDYANEYYYMRKYTADGQDIEGPWYIYAQKTLGSISIVSGMYGWVQYIPRYKSVYGSELNYYDKNYMDFELVWATEAKFTVEPVDITKNNEVWTTTTCRIKGATGYGTISEHVGSIYPCIDIPPISGYTIQAELYYDTDDEIVKMRQIQPYIHILEPGQVTSASTVQLTRTGETINWNGDLWAWTIDTVPLNTHVALGYNYSSKTWFACGAQCYPSPVCSII